MLRRVGTTTATELLSILLFVWIRVTYIIKTLVVLRWCYIGTVVYQNFTLNLNHVVPWKSVTYWYKTTFSTRPISKSPENFTTHTKGVGCICHPDRLLDRGRKEKISFNKKVKQPVTYRSIGNSTIVVFINFFIPRHHLKPVTNKQNRCSKTLKFPRFFYSVEYDYRIDIDKPSQILHPSNKTRRQNAQTALSKRNLFRVSITRRSGVASARHIDRFMSFGVNPTNL